MSWPSDLADHRDCMIITIGTTVLHLRKIDTQCVDVSADERSAEKDKGKIKFLELLIDMNTHAHYDCSNISLFHLSNFVY